ncbi:hypothetical protein F5Y06DRAFT_308559 [Hypoxylon sp. FL0890]|nr:hypothetical protein F5Y06DRAFT_308559 [Hypoxylon sp. FL0890]
MKTKDYAPHSQGREVAMDFNDSSNLRISLSTRNHEASLNSSAPDALTYLPTPPTSPNPAAQHLEGWFAYPPRPLPALEEAPIKESPGALRDLERFTDQHMKRSAALRKWTEEVKKTREALSVDRLCRKIALLRELHQISVEGSDVATRAAAQVKAREIKQLPILSKEDDAFVNFESTQNHASALHRAQQTFETYRRKASRGLSRVESLLGSDGSDPAKYGLSKDVHIYYLGSPLQLYNIPFDQAVAAGLEDVGVIPNPLLQSLSITPQPGSLQALLHIPGTYPPAVWSPLKNSNIPDWFASYKLRLPGEDLETGWKNLLNSIGELETAIRQMDAQETPKKPKWDKEWHEPNSKWPYPHRRKHGGWWKCRAGPDAPRAEALCTLCHEEKSAPEDTVQTSEPRAQLKAIMDAVEEAMGEVAKRDKGAAMEDLRPADEVEEVLPMGDLHITTYTPEAAGQHVYRREGYSLLRGVEEVDDIQY